MGFFVHHQTSDMYLKPVHRVRSIFKGVLNFDLTGSSLPNPVIVWTQKSHLWSRVRGLQGDPLQWGHGVYTKGKLFQSVSEKGSHRYGIAVDEKRDNVCWSDLDSSKAGIYCQAFNNTINGDLDTKFAVVRQDSQEIRDITIDWQTGNVYYAANTWIVVAPTVGSTTNVYKVLFSANLTNPSGITLDSDTRYISTGHTSYIMVTWGIWCDKVNNFAVVGFIENPNYICTLGHMTTF